jgi:uncharacterized glyoxalase superfamily protein PhnB
MTTELIKITPSFIVPNVVAAAEYYRDVLDFSSPIYDGEPPNFALVQSGNASFMFKSHPDLPRSFPNARLHEDVGWDAYLWVSNADTYYRQVKERGANIVQDIGDRYYGCRDFELKDLNGYLICIGQEL